MSYYDRDRMNETARLNAGTMNHTYAHHSSVSEYQSSGIPFVHTFTIDRHGSQARIVQGATLSGSEETGAFTGKPHSNPLQHSGTYWDLIKRIDFPFVTRWVMVKVYLWDGDSNGNATDEHRVKIGFGNATDGEGVQSSSWVSTGVANNQRLELKCKKLYISFPGEFAGNDSSWVTDSADRYIRVEVIAGLTGVSNFPDLDSEYYVGISSHQYNGGDPVQGGTSYTMVTTTNSTVNAG